MPYYKWQGIDILGEWQQGALFARDHYYVEKFLLSRDIALVHCREKRKLFSLLGIATLRAYCLRQLALLLEANFRIQDALEFVRSSLSHVMLKDILHDCKQAVDEGLSLATACSYHPLIFDTVTVALMSAGEASGRLKKLLARRADFLEKQQALMQKLRSSLLIPVITFSVFLVVSAVIFLVIIPRFATFVTRTQQPLPKITQIIFGMSSWLQHVLNLKAALMGGCILVALIALIQYLRRGALLDWLVIKIPGIARLVEAYGLTFYVQALGLLIESGVPIIFSLRLATQAVGNKTLRRQCLQIEQLVDQGQTVHGALYATFPAHHELIELVKIGEQAGMLDQALLQASSLYEERLHRTFTWIVTSIQPLLIIILGLCIGLLMLAVYMPILTLTTTSLH